MNIPTEGKWFNDVRISSAYLGESSEKKTPFVALELECMDGGELSYYEWKGWLTNTVNQKTGKTLQQLVIKTLMQCGFLSNKLSDIADENKSIKELFGATASPINALVKPETYEKDGETKTVYKVDAITVSEGKAKFSKTQAVTKFASMNIDADMALIRNEVGSSTPF